MNKSEVKKLIESAIFSGNKTPRVFDLPEIMRLKAKLEASDSIARVICILEDDRMLLSNSFGISASVFDECLQKLNALNVTTQAEVS
jgi:hypothetical protein